MIHFLLLCQNYPLPDNEIHQKNVVLKVIKNLINLVDYKS